MSPPTRTRKRLTEVLKRTATQEERFQSCLANLWPSNFTMVGMTTSGRTFFNGVCLYPITVGYNERTGVCVKGMLAVMAEMNINEDCDWQKR
jgi:hypothetical protein